MVSYLPHIVFLTVVIGAFAFFISSTEKQKNNQSTQAVQSIKKGFCRLPSRILREYKLDELAKIPNGDSLIIERLTILAQDISDINRLHTELQNVVDNINLLDTTTTSIEPLVFAMIDLQDKKENLKKHVENKMTNKDNIQTNKGTYNNMVNDIKNNAMYKQAQLITFFKSNEVRPLEQYIQDINKIRSLSSTILKDIEKLKLQLDADLTEKNLPYNQCAFEMLVNMKEEVDTIMNKTTEYNNVLSDEVKKTYIEQLIVSTKNDTMVNRLIELVNEIKNYITESEQIIFDKSKENNLSIWSINTNIIIGFVIIVSVVFGIVIGKLIFSTVANR